MIELEHINKGYPTRLGPVEVLKDINLTIGRGESICILGGNGSGKSTLIRIIGGTERPTSGAVRRDMRLSWPLAFTGAFQGALTGYDNLRFICRIYGTDYHEAIDFVEDFAQLGRYLREPLKSYSSGMRARLAFAVSMVIDFDCYLIDEVTAVGDARFQQRCHEELFVKRKDRSFIIVSHDATYVKEHCDRGSVIANGKLRSFGSVEEAQAIHMEMMMAPLDRSLEH